jgi:hypothetical protein
MLVSGGENALCPDVGRLLAIDTPAVQTAPASREAHDLTYSSGIVIDQNRNVAERSPNTCTTSKPVRASVGRHGLFARGGFSFDAPGCAT